MTNKPIHKLREGSLQCAIWKNEAKIDGIERTLYSVTLDRSYRDSEGNWQSTKSYRANDLIAASKLLADAYAYLEQNRLIEEYSRG